MLPQRESLLRYFSEQCIYYQKGNTHEGEEFKNQNRSLWTGCPDRSEERRVGKECRL